MPATVKVGMIRLALTFKNNEVFWFVVGRTQTPWDYEASPPQEDVDTVSLVEIGGLQRAQTVSLCYPDPNGAIEFRGQKYSLVSDEHAYEYDSRFLYCSTLLRFDEFPLVTFRQFGVSVGVIPKPGYEANMVLTPDQVLNYGVLIGYVNHPPVVRTAGSKQLLEIVIELVPKVTI